MNSALSRKSRMLKTEIYHVILQKMREFNREELSEPGFEDELWNHFNRLPIRYATDVNIDGPEDVLMHMKLLQLAYESATKSAFEIRIVLVPVSDVSYSGTADSNFMSTVDPENSDCSTKPSQPTLAFGISPSLELALEATKSNGQVVGDGERRYFRYTVNRYDVRVSESNLVDNYLGLFSLTSLLSEIGLNIQEAHAFSTTDGYSLDVFVVDSWSSEGTERLKDVLECKLPKIESISRTSSNQKFVSPAEVSEATTELAKLRLELDQSREREKAAKTKLSQITEEAYVKGYRGGFLEGLGLGYNMGLDAAKIPAEAELRAVPEVPVPDVQMPSEKISEQAIDVDS